jgi:hypothetical protein
MKRLYILTFFSLTISLCILGCKGIRSKTVPYGKGLVIDKSWMVNNDSIVTPVKDRRPADQTFLTYPEWFLVFSPAEQAAYYKTHTATNFPYLTHIHQFWKSYRIVKKQIRGNYKYNLGYHFMIKVIGYSATFEYGVKSLYENTIGRLSDLGDHGTLTEEDTFYSKYTQEYVDFIRVRPWYEFNFITQLPKLWKISFFARHPIRKIERKSFLTADILFKTIYGGLIKIGTRTAYDVALPNTVVLVDRLPLTGLEELPQLERRKVYADSSVLISIPRYEEFKPYVTKLALQGVAFKEVAGNSAAIFLTVWIPSENTLTTENEQLVFTQIISSQPTMKRIGLAVRVKDLNKLLVRLHNNHIEVEHIFDF